MGDAMPGRVPVGSTTTKAAEEPAATKAGETKAGETEPVIDWDPGAADEVTPDYLIPKMREQPVSPPAYYKRLFIYDIDAPTDHAATIGAAIDPFDTSVAPPPQTPAIGVLLTHEQGWFEEGLALGRLSHSLCLAPGEVTKVAVVGWEGRTAASQSAVTTQQEAVTAATDQNQHVQAVQQAVAHEAQTGVSTSMTMGNQTQAGMSASTPFFGASGSTSFTAGLGLAASHSSGDRDLAASSAKQIHQRTQEMSNSTRSRRATQVREVSESETSTATSRVVANYNHMHALTVLYFEVLQVFELSTKVIEAERCIFLPMQPVEFDSAAVERHQELLLAIIHDLGQDALCQSINVFIDTKRDLLKEAAAAEASIPALEKASQEGTAAAREALVRYANAQSANSTPFASEVLQAQVAWQAAVKAGTAADMALSEARAKARALRQGVDLAGRDVTKILQKMRLLLNQHMWMRVEPHVWQQIVLDKVHMAPKPEALGGRMDPHPIGVFGNYVAFRWPSDDPAFRARFVKDDLGVPNAKVALPSGGLFAEAVLGQANAAEKINLTRFWNWKESPIPILPPDMQPLSLASRARDVSFAAFDFAPVVAQLKDQKMPDDDIDKVLGAIKDSMFRDQSGMEALSKQLIQQAIGNASGATAAGGQALEGMKSAQSFVTNVLNSEVAKTIAGAAVKAVAPEAEGASMLGGLLNAAGPGKANGAAKPKATGTTTTKGKPSGGTT
jgi:hypothetical protein